LKNELNIPGGISLSFFEFDHGDFIERYGIATVTNSGTEILLLDAFYPKSLEDTIAPIVIDALNSTTSVIGDL